MTTVINVVWRRNAVLLAKQLASVAELSGGRLTAGIAGVREAWSAAGRQGPPRIVVERYFCLGAGADAIADRYLEHYYGQEYLPHVRADTLTSESDLRTELARLQEAGCDDVVLLPCSPELDQVELLAGALEPAVTAR